MRLMILGAGVYQVPLIKKAKEMGHETIVVSPVGNYPGLAIADNVVDCDTRDHEAVLNAAIEFGIDGIVTTGTDVAVPTIGYIVDMLGLKGTGFESAKRSMNKALMKKCFIDGGVKTAEFKTVSSLDELLVSANVIGYPVMIKAVDSSGSRGITKVTCEEEVKNAFDFAKLVSESSEVIVEEFLEGIEFGADTVVDENGVVEVFIHDKVVSPPPTSAPVGHSMPSVLPSKIQVEVEKEITKAVNSLGLKNTISNADVMLVGETPYIIEIGARMGATCIPENISIYLGFDIYEYLINLSLGLSPKLPGLRVNQPNAAQLIVSNKSGKVRSIHIPEHVANLVDLSIDVSVGDTVREFKVGPDRVGQVITIGRNQVEAVSLAQKIASQIEVVVD